jgi:hypothetical protein
MIGGDLGRCHLGRADPLLEELAGCSDVPTWGSEHVDDLTELVDRSVAVAPASGDLHVGLIDEPAVADQMAAWPGGVDRQWHKPPHPPVDRDVVNFDSSLGEQFLYVAIGQAEAQVPPDGEDDHLGG